MIRTILFMSLIAFSAALIYPQHSFAMEEMGTIQVSPVFSSGERASIFGQVLKLYQDNNSTVFRTITPTAYPIIIDSLPIDHKYKIDTYRYNMYAATTIVDLKESYQKVDSILSPDSGIRFNVYYKDGATSVSDVSVSLYSHNGTRWFNGNTDDKGNTVRTWIPSPILQDNFYEAKFSLGSHLSYTYPSKITPSSGEKQDYKIVTPWPSVLDSLITLSVYKSPSEKISQSDGKYLVVIVDKSGNIVAKSNVDPRGDAYFSKLSVKPYTVHVIKDQKPIFSEIGVRNMLFTPEKLQGDVFLENFGNGTLVVFNGTKLDYDMPSIVTPPIIPNTTINQTTVDSPPLTAEESCNCVAFRLDDVQDRYVRASDLSVMNLFLKKNKPLLLGIIANDTGKDIPIIETVKQGIHKELFYPAVHGYEHNDFSDTSSFDQYLAIKLSNDKFFTAFGNYTDVFIPPFNHVNNGTVNALIKNNFKMISSSVHSATAKDVYMYTENSSNDPSNLLHIPQLTEFPISREEVTFKPISVEEVVNNIEYNLKSVGYSIITLHPQDFANRENGRLINTPNSVNQTSINLLSQLIDELDAKNIKIVSIHNIPNLQPQTFSISDTSPGITHDSSVVNVYTLGTNPSGISVNPKLNSIYIVNSESDTMSIINSKTHSFMGLIPVGNGPIGIFVNPVTDMIYVINSFDDNITVINGLTNTVQGTLDIGVSPYGISGNPSENIIYLLDPYTPSLSFLDGSSNRIVDSVPLENIPQRIAVDHKTNMIYLTSLNSNSITIIDGSTKKISDTINLDGDDQPLAIGVNSNTNTIYVTNSKSNSITIIDGSTKKISDTINLDGDDQPLAIGVNSNTNTIYVTNSKSNSITIIDGSTKKISDTINLDGDDQPLAIGVNSNTNTIYVTNSKSGSVTVIDGNTKNILGILPLNYESLPSWITIDDTTNIVYVANTKTNTVSVIDPKLISEHVIPEFTFTSLMILTVSLFTVMILSSFKFKTLKIR